MTRDEQIRDAMYRGDINALDKLARCECCCDEHYSLDCPAHVWMGCRGSYAPNRYEMEQMKLIEDRL